MVTLNPDDMSTVAQDVYRMLVNKQHISNATMQKSVWHRRHSVQIADPDLDKHRARQD